MSEPSLPLVTFRALERKGLAYRDHEAHPASPLGQRIAPTPLGLFALARFTGLTFPSSAARLWPSHPPKHLTAAPTALPSPHHPDRGDRPCR
ncbi:hypothetical protein ACFVP0_10080 [Streptomyces cinereoruber]|uniref:hypothetical protein n=1 Tax=Streptomyces cinereoruber TaxID=67260 RepID=UPI0036C727DB